MPRHKGVIKLVSHRRCLLTTQGRKGVDVNIPAALAQGRNDSKAATSRRVLKKVVGKQKGEGG